MKKFNKVIKIEVSIDTIANQLLATIDKDNPHRELLTEQIIGNLNATNRLSGVYNALTGHHNDIDFDVNQEVWCNDTVYYRAPNRDTSEYHVIGNCKIVEIDEFKDQPIKVEYVYFRHNVKFDNNMEKVVSTQWIRMDKLEEEREKEHGYEFLKESDEKAFYEYLQLNVDAVEELVDANLPAEEHGAHNH